MSKDERPISDQLKQVVDELQLEERVKEVAAAAEGAVLRGLEATSSYLRDHRDDIEEFLERAGTAIDRQTSGRFADRVEQVRSQLSAGVATLADRPWTNPSGDELEAEGPTAPPGSTDEG
jgi:ABC-type transporter Mla subunit MlaD